MPLDAARIALPAGYRAREFRDEDREPLVEARNREVDKMERQDANEWREWERMMPDASQERVVFEGPDGAVAGMANIGKGGMPQPDGALFAGVGVIAHARRKGIGTAAAAELERVARERGAPRILAGASDAMPFAIKFALDRGFRELGRRIESYVRLATFEEATYAPLLDAPRSHGVTLRTFGEELDGKDDAARDALFRRVWDAEAEMWEDIPFPSPTPHWPYERFRKLIVDSGKLIPEASMIAYRNGEIAGFTTTGRRGDPRDGYTWMTGVARAHRGRGIAHALKVDALRRAKALGMRALFTTNDEPNKAMRGINAKLGYVMLPAFVQLEKKLS